MGKAWVTGGMSYIMLFAVLHISIYMGLTSYLVFPFFILCIEAAYH